MNNLIDKFISKVDHFASRPGRLMAMVDVLLSWVTPKDIASAACPIWYENCSSCGINSCCGLNGTKGIWTGKKKCWFQSSACNIKVCNPCPKTNYVGCGCGTC